MILLMYLLVLSQFHSLIVLCSSRLWVCVQTLRLMILLIVLWKACNIYIYINICCSRLSSHCLTLLSGVSPSNSLFAMVALSTLRANKKARGANPMMMLPHMMPGMMNGMMPGMMGGMMMPPMTMPHHGAEESDEEEQAVPPLKGCACCSVWCRVVVCCIVVCCNVCCSGEWPHCHCSLGSSPGLRPHQQVCDLCPAIAPQPPGGDFGDAFGGRARCGGHGWAHTGWLADVALALLPHKAVCKNQWPPFLGRVEFNFVEFLTWQCEC